MSRSDAWIRWFWLWDAFFAVVYVSVVVLMINETGASAAERTGSVAALTGIIPLYALVGRRQMRADVQGLRAKVFLAGTLALFLTAILFVPSNSIVMFAICPMIFMSLPLRSAMIVVAASMSLPLAVNLIRRGFDFGYVLRYLPLLLLSIAFAVLIGTWIDRVVTQSAERADLIAKLEASQTEVSRLSHEAGVTAERERLAGEIHDTLAQGFTSIVTLVQAAESELGRDEAEVRRHLGLAVRAARENLAESRALVAALAPAELTESSLVDAIRRQGARLTEETGIGVAVSVQGDRRPLPTAADVVLLRTVQEGLTNVRKHAAASQAEVTLSYQESSVVVIVSDDGRGFDPAQDTGGFGLRGMSARVEQAGGSLTVTSSPGAGTTLELEVPA